ncbi:3128_t:CDS:2, partial [Dentiscutata erythropus]
MADPFFNKISQLEKTLEHQLKEILRLEYEIQERKNSLDFFREENCLLKQKLKKLQKYATNQELEINNNYQHLHELEKKISQLENIFSQWQAERNKIKLLQEQNASLYSTVNNLSSQLEEKKNILRETNKLIQEQKKNLKDGETNLYKIISNYGALCIENLSLKTHLSDKNEAIKQYKVLVSDFNDKTNSEPINYISYSSLAEIKLIDITQKYKKWKARFKKNNLRKNIYNPDIPNQNKSNPKNMADAGRLTVLPSIAPILAAYPSYTGQVPPDEYLDGLEGALMAIEANMAAAEGANAGAFNEVIRCQLLSSKMAGRFTPVPANDPFTVGAPAINTREYQLRIRIGNPQTVNEFFQQLRTAYHEFVKRPMPHNFGFYPS